MIQFNLSLSMGGYYHVRRNQWWRPSPPRMPLRKGVQTHLKARGSTPSVSLLLLLSIVNLLSSGYGASAASVVNSDKFLRGVDKSEGTASGTQDRKDYAKAWAKYAKKNMYDAYQHTELADEPPENHLPSEEDVELLYEGMYDSFQERNVTNSTSNYTQADVMTYLTDRTTTPGSATEAEVSFCADLFTAALVRQNQTTMNLTDPIKEEYTEELKDPIEMTVAVALDASDACDDQANAENLQALGYNATTFCPHFHTVVPLRVQTLPPEISSNMLRFCSFIVDNVFLTAGEPQCFHAMEEVVLSNAIANGTEHPFPAVAMTKTFNKTFLDICDLNNYEGKMMPIMVNSTDASSGPSDTGPIMVNSTDASSGPSDTGPPSYCYDLLDSVVDTALTFARDGNISNVEFISDLCDAFDMPLPHPNETIPVRYTDTHVHHKPGGKTNIKIRHILSDLFNYAGHYKHGFIDSNHNWIENASDGLMDPEVELAPLAKMHPRRTSQDTDIKSETKIKLEGSEESGASRAQVGLYCTKVAFSVGLGIEISAGPMSLGGGIDFGFGYAQNGIYEEVLAWSICGSVAGAEIPFGPQAIADAADSANTKKSKAKQTMDAAEAGGSIGISGGFWSQTRAIPGFSEVNSISVTFVLVSVGISIIETFNGDFWTESTGINGLMFDFGVSWPPNPGKALDVDLGVKCYSGKMVGQEVSISSSEESNCAPPKYSFDLWASGGGQDHTNTGLSVYYYKTEYDFLYNKRNKIWIRHHCGYNDGFKPPYGGIHFHARELYAVGMVAHGDDAMVIEQLKVMQKMTSGLPEQWVAVYTMDHTKYRMCLSTNDGPTCHSNIEWVVTSEGSSNRKDQVHASCNGPSEVGYNRCSKYISFQGCGRLCKSVRDVKHYDTGCGGGMSLWIDKSQGRHKSRVYNTVGNWRSAADRCGRHLKYHGIISSYSIYIEYFSFWPIAAHLWYNPVAQYRTECTDNLGVEYYTGGPWRTEKVWHINKFEWIDGCESCGNYLRYKGLIKWNYQCNKDWYGVYLSYRSSDPYVRCNHVNGLPRKPIVCVDFPPLWHDSDGAKYNCAWYGEADRCARYGSGYARSGYTANRACCACGGGVHVDSLHEESTSERETVTDIAKSLS